MTIRGANLSAGAAVASDGVASASVTAPDSTTLVAEAPAHAVARVDVAYGGSEIASGVSAGALSADGRLVGFISPPTASSRVMRTAASRTRAG